MINQLPTSVSPLDERPTLAGETHNRLHALLSGVHSMTDLAQKTPDEQKQFFALANKEIDLLSAHPHGKKKLQRRHTATHASQCPQWYRLYKQYKGQLDYLHTVHGMSVEAVIDRLTSIKELGSRPVRINPYDTIIGRFPSSADSQAKIGGFDPGVALFLGLIPEEYAGISAKLHANYTPDALEQAKSEINQLHTHLTNGTMPEYLSETTYRLAACTLAHDGAVLGAQDMEQQIADRTAIMNNPQELMTRAAQEYTVMSSTFTTDRGYPYGEKDGCIQGAYLAGHSYGVLYSEDYGGYFVGTYKPGLGLENFDRQDLQSTTGQKAGPFHGSQQFVFCATEEQMEAVMKIVQKNFSTT